MEFTQNQLILFFAAAAWFYGFTLPPILKMVKRRNLSLFKVIIGTERAQGYTIKEKLLMAVGVAGGLALAYIATVPE